MTLDTVPAMLARTACVERTLAMLKTNVTTSENEQKVLDQKVRQFSCYHILFIDNLFVLENLRFWPPNQTIDCFLGRGIV